ncbi:MAG: hemerythrin family protein [Sulfurospirillaceae bacterium]|nr:hemerythrin family protein [Sulfurospirillaceae bacterium]
MSIEWQERFSLKNEKIDAQHKELFRLTNCARQLDEKSTTKEELANLFKEFFNYMKEHFAEEEAYMQSIEYPYFAHHKKLHEDFIKNFTAILKEKKTIFAIQEAMKAITHKWLVEHILENDLKIEQWRKDTFVPVTDTNPLS